MRRIVLAVLATVALAMPAFADEHFPEPTGFVNDIAKAVPDDVQQEVEARLAAFQRTSGNEVAIAVLDSTGSDSIEDYANDLFEHWGVGKENENNGVLLLIAIGDRRLRIEVGLEADDELTDLESGRIVRDLLVPRLRSGDVGEAVRVGAAAIVEQLGGDGGAPAPPPGAQPVAGRRGGGGLPLLLILLTFLFFGALGRMGSSRRRGFRGGGADWSTPLLLGALLGSRGGWGGGRGGGFGGGGGGFGGFGGGGSGGGGASGSW